MHALIRFILAAIFGTWLLLKLSSWPEAVWRALAFACGLLLAVGMTVGGVWALGQLELDDDVGLMFFFWAGVGVVIMVKAGKR